MKKLFLYIALALLPTFSNAQIENGIKIITGTGSVHSKNLNTITEKNKEHDPYLIRSNVHTRYGLNIGLGYFINYTLNNKLSLSTDISLNILSSHLYVNYFRDSAGPVKGLSHRISSEAKINLLYLNIPFMLRYCITGRNNLFLIAGPSLHLMANPHLHSRELSVINSYQNNTIDSTSIVRKKTDAVLNKHKKVQLNFVLGIEKRFSQRMKNISLGLICQIPLTRGEMYSTDGSLNYSINNKLLGNEAKQEAEQRDSRHKLNDFRLSTFSIIVKYYFKEKK
jgi:hypothetical protein